MSVILEDIQILIQEAVDMDENGTETATYSLLFHYKDGGSFLIDYRASSHIDQRREVKFYLQLLELLRKNELQGREIKNKGLRDKVIDLALKHFKDPELRKRRDEVKTIEVEAEELEIPSEPSEEELAMQQTQQQGADANGGEEGATQQPANTKEATDDNVQPTDKGESDNETSPPKSESKKDSPDEKKKELASDVTNAEDDEEDKKRKNKILKSIKKIADNPEKKILDDIKQLIKEL